MRSITREEFSKLEVSDKMITKTKEEAVILGLSQTSENWIVYSLVPIEDEDDLDISDVIYEVIESAYEFPSKREAVDLYKFVTSSMLR